MHNEGIGDECIRQIVIIIRIIIIIIVTIIIIIILIIFIFIIITIFIIIKYDSMDYDNHHWLVMIMAYYMVIVFDVLNDCPIDQLSDFSPFIWFLDQFFFLAIDFVLTHDIPWRIQKYGQKHILNN